jgi:hypothetical protein
MRMLLEMPEISGDSAHPPPGKSAGAAHIQPKVKCVWILVVWVTFDLTAGAYPIEPDTKTLLKAFERQDTDYPPARVGWQQKAPKPVNPMLESLRYPYTREAMAAQIAQWATPDLRLMGIFGLLIFTLRYYRARKSPGRNASAPVAIGEERSAQPPLAA